MLLLILTAACGHKPKTAHLPPPPVPAPSRVPTTTPKTTTTQTPTPTPAGDETGYASWYGHPYHGRPTANGEVYDMNAMTAAHRTLAMGTLVGVTNEDNGKHVEVRINDRGPFIEGRVIDLSYAAAKAIEMIGPGLAMVRLSILGMAESAASVFGVQVGAFRERENAERLQQRVSQKHSPVELRDDGGLWRVLVGAESSEAAAQALAKNLRRERFGGMVVPIR